MPTCVISFALLLTAIAAGMFLLAKTNKDNLGNFFRFVSWFIIVSGFLGIFLCGMMCMFRMCCHQNMERERMMMLNNGMPGGCNEMMEGGMNKRIIIKNCEDEDKGCTEMGGDCEKNEQCEKGSHCEKGGDCCKGGDKEKNILIKRDTVIVKTK